MSAPKIKVAVVQAASVVWNSEKSVEKLAKLTKEAADAGAKLVLFPEVFISGYPHLIDFGKPGIPEPKARDNYKRYWESSVDVPGPIVTQLENIARENKIYLVTGVTERDQGTLYCCVLFFNDEGKFLGKHRKLVPTCCERIFWGRGDGSTLPVFDLPIGKIGAVICWENYMPLLRTTMYSKGIQIYLAPTADDTDGWVASMRHIALEGRCYVLGCNQYVTKNDYPEDLAKTLGCTSDVVCKGQSCIVSPLGELLAGPNTTSEGILYADIDLAEVVRAKFDMDSVGHYSRPDVFTLHVNENETSTVVTDKCVTHTPLVVSCEQLQKESCPCPLLTCETTTDKVPDVPPPVCCEKTKESCQLQGCELASVVPPAETPVPVEEKKASSENTDTPVATINNDPAPVTEAPLVSAGDEKKEAACPAVETPAVTTPPQDNPVANLTGSQDVVSP